MLTSSRTLQHHTMIWGVFKNYQYTPTRNSYCFSHSMSQISGIYK